MPSIKLITLNVERNRHWDDIIPFIKRESPDVLCLQELFERDAKMIAERFNYDYVYMPRTRIAYDSNNPESLENEGSGLFSKFPIENKNKAYYYEAAAELQTSGGETAEEKRKTLSQGIVWGTILANETPFTVASTHFTWTPNGQPDTRQDADIKSLFKITDNIPSLVLCGDFNVPRGDNRIYFELLRNFKDNIPLDVPTTMDVARHRVRDNPTERERLAKYVVDYIFSTPEYTVNNVRAEFSVSDHAAVIATISRKAA